MIDVNISCGNWPFRDFSRFSPERLLSHLAAHGITGGFISSIDSVFQEDLERVHAVLAEAFQFAAPDFIPVATVNPAIATTICFLERTSPKLTRLIPNYHDYSLNDGPSDDVACWCVENNSGLLIQRRMSDERAHHPRCKVPSTPLEDIAEFASRHPNLRILCLNLYFHEAAKLPENLPNIHIDISSVETFNTVETLLGKIPDERVLFGSNTPFFYTKSAIMKLETANLPEKTRQSISVDNAKSFLG